MSEQDLGWDTTACRPVRHRDQTRWAAGSRRDFELDHAESGIGDLDGDRDAGLAARGNGLMRLIRLYIGRLCFKLSMCLAIAGKTISGI
ncbi:hypothetical protein ACVIJW_009885 [Bradyrhizobium barranii subsp. barranii]